MPVHSRMQLGCKLAKIIIVYLLPASSIAAGMRCCITLSRAKETVLGSESSLGVMQTPPYPEQKQPGHEPGEVRSKVLRMRYWTHLTRELFQ